MDMRLQLMARQMGINIEDLHVAPVQEVADSSGGSETVMWMFQRSQSIRIYAQVLLIHNLVLSHVCRVRSPHMKFCQGIAMQQ